MKTSKQSPKVFSKSQILFGFSLLVIAVAWATLPFIKIDITPSARQNLAKLLPQTHGSLSYSQVFLKGNLSLEFVDFKYRPDPPLSFSSPITHIKVSIWKILKGDLNLIDIEADRFTIDVPTIPPWMDKQMWELKSKEVLERREWMSFMQSHWKFDTLVVALPNLKYEIHQFRSNQKLINGTWNTLGHWKYGWSKTMPNLNEGTYHMQFYPDSFRAEFVTETALGPLSIKALKNINSKRVKGTLDYEGNMEQLSAWLFEPNTQLNGFVRANLSFETHLLSPLNAITAKGKLQGNELVFQGLKFQESNTIAQFAPHFKKFRLKNMTADLSINKNQFFLKSLEAKGPEIQLKGYLKSNWLGQFGSRFNVVLSENSTKKLSTLAQKSLPINNKNEANFNLEISGTPKQHQIDNLGELISGAIQKNIRSLGEKLLDLF